MGVRFACHSCGKRLNIKADLAGRRGVCPACSVRFRIPTEDQPHSISIESEFVDLDIEMSGDHSSDAGQSMIGQSSGVNGSAQPVGAPNGATATVQASSVKPNRMAASSPSPQPRPDPPDVLGDTSATWYVRPPSGGQYGPADGPTMKQWILEGRIAESSMLWRDGWADWKPAKDTLHQIQHPKINTTSVPAIDSPKSILASPGNAHLVDPTLPSTQGDATVLQRSGQLDSSKRKRSRKRIAATVVLGLVLLGLVVVLAAVVMR